MAKIIELTYSFGRTIQLTQFNPLNIHVSAKAEITEKDDIKKSLEELKMIVQCQVNEDIYKAQNPPKEVKQRQPSPFKGLHKQGPGFNLPN